MIPPRTNIPWCDACGCYHIRGYVDCVRNLPLPDLGIRHPDPRIRQLEVALEEAQHDVYEAQARGYGQGYRDGYRDGRAE